MLILSRTIFAYSLDSNRSSGIASNSGSVMNASLSKKAAFSDRDAFITDPEFEAIPLDRLLSREYAKIVRDRISMSEAMPPPLPLSYSRHSDTVYVTAVDEERNAVSLISSIF